MSSLLCDMCTKSVCTMMIIIVVVMTNDDDICMC